MGHPLTIKELRHALTSAGFRVLDTTAIMHNPRLVAVGMMRMARIFGLETSDQVLRENVTRQSETGKNLLALLDRKFHCCPRYSV